MQSSNIEVDVKLDDEAQEKKQLAGESVACKSYTNQDKSQKSGFQVKKNLAFLSSKLSNLMKK